MKEVNKSKPIKSSGKNSMGLDKLNGAQLLGVVNSLSAAVKSGTDYLSEAEKTRQVYIDSQAKVQIASKEYDAVYEKESTSRLESNNHREEKLAEIAQKGDAANYKHLQIMKILSLVESGGISSEALASAISAVQD